MSDIMRRKDHRTERTEGWIVLVPVVVKTLDGIWCSPLGEKERFPVLHHVEPASSLYIPSRANLFEIAGQKSHHAGMVSEVDGFDLASQTSLAHYLRLTSNPLVPVSAHCKQNHLVEPSARVSEQFENDFLSARDLSTLHHGVKNRVDTRSDIS